MIPCAGLATRFLPLSKELSKELWPLVDKPLIHYILEGLLAAGIEQIIFVLSPEKKQVLDYLKKRDTANEKILEKRGKEQALLELKNLYELQKNFSLSYVLQKKPLGNGHAVLQAQDKVGNEPFLVVFPDDIIEAETPSFVQLLKVFKTCQRPVIGLYRVPPERISYYGIVQVEKIASRFFKLKKIVEKPILKEAPSDLAVVGHYVLTPEIFDYLKAQKAGQKHEIWLAEALADILKDGKIIYGYELEGHWLECGNKQEWLKANLYQGLKHPQYGPELKRYLKQIL